MWSKCIFILFGVLLIKNYSAYAHDAGHTNGQTLHVPASVSQSRVKIWSDKSYRYISSNGLPNHSTGSFPNRNNPHRITEQNYKYKVPLSPKPSGRKTDMLGQPFGVAINGVPFDPGTAECFGQPRGGRPGSACQWREEAIQNGMRKLGLDQSNAHVQPSGAYHYHGIPRALANSLSGDLVHVGYAADGFRMFVSKSSQYKSGYRLRPGYRSSGPGGRYDGKYTQDFVYDGKTGNLDQCNGTIVNGEYVYILTSSFPFIPRCWSGTPDSSFERRHSSGSMPRVFNGGRHRPPPPHRR